MFSGAAVWRGEGRVPVMSSNEPDSPRRVPLSRGTKTPLEDDVPVASEPSCGEETVSGAGGTFLSSVPVTI